MAEKYIDFRALKERISITAVLDHYGVQLRSVGQHSLRGKCPLPTHNSQKSFDSFGADTGKNIWACQSSSCAAARGGKKGGNVIDFVAVMESCSVRDAAIKLNQWFGTSAHNATKQNEPPTKKEKLVAEKTGEVNTDREVNKPLTFTLSGIDSSHAYLRQRGITEETARCFGVGYFPGKGLMNGRVVVPIHNKGGELVAYAGRTIDNAEPKYRFPAGFRKSIELFNLHRVGESDRVVVVEGFFDCMKVSQAGFSCVALMGSSLSVEQEALVAEKFGRVLFLFDGDDAGRKATDECLLRLGRQMLIMAVMLPEGKQPDGMSSDELKAALRSF